MSVSPLKARRCYTHVKARLASRTVEAELLFDLIGCLDSAPVERVAPWFKLIHNYLLKAGLSWRDIAHMLREASRRSF